MTKCNLCPRGCGVDRTMGERGYCGMADTLRVSKAMLHMWEEPPISGTRGSGAVFFSGCHLKCIYCQNTDIAHGGFGKDMTPVELARVFLYLEEKGAHNINLVTPTHFTYGIISALDIARDKGLKLPVVYNTGGYELVRTLDMLRGCIDVYLPDFKYMKTRSAKNYSNAPDYPEVAKKALEAMVNRCPEAVFNKDGIMEKGVIVRHMLLPGNLENSKLVIEYLYKTYGDSIYISIMSQYTPIKEFESYPELSYTAGRREYEKLVDYALGLGVKNAFIQDTESAQNTYVPSFDLGGL